MVNGTLLNFGKRYEDKFRVIFYQWPKLHLGLDALSNQKILKGILLNRPHRIHDESSFPQQFSNIIHNSGSLCKSTINHYRSCIRRAVSKYTLHDLLPTNGMH